jgi:RNA-binding protein YhbY
MKKKIDGENLYKISAFADKKKISKQLARYRAYNNIGCELVKINGGVIVYYDEKVHKD